MTGLLSTARNGLLCLAVSCVAVSAQTLTEAEFEELLAEQRRQSAQVEIEALPPLENSPSVTAPVSPPEVPTPLSATVTPPSPPSAPPPTVTAPPSTAALPSEGIGGAGLLAGGAAAAVLVGVVALALGGGGGGDSTPSSIGTR